VCVYVRVDMCMHVYVYMHASECAHLGRW